jgi:hypothetical protein
MSNPTPAEELELAAQIMEERGKHEGGFLNRVTGEVCALGAIWMAQGYPEELLAEEGDNPKGECVDVLGRHLLDVTDGGKKIFPPWFNHYHLYGIYQEFMNWAAGDDLDSLIYRANDQTHLDMAHEMRMAAKKWRANHE